MKKRDLASLAVIGVTAGMMVSGCQQFQKKTSPKKPQKENGNNHQMSPEMKSFYANLSPDAQKEFMSLDAHHKMMAMEMAQQKCHGQNSCAGMGGCKTAEHSCAGKNSCKGEGGPPIKDPNKAVHVQYQQQQAQSNS